MAQKVQQHTRDQESDHPVDHDGNPGQDLKEISSIKQFLNEAKEENKRIWYLAGPAIFAFIGRYSLGAITLVFAGHLTTLELDAVSTGNLVITGLAFGIMKFLLAQSKVMITAAVAGAALVFHLFLNWLLIVQLRLGLAGAAIALNASWWFVVLGQFTYIAMGYCPGVWNGFSRLAFKNLGAFTKLSIGSAIMMCLEFWFLMILIVIAGNLKNAQIAVAAMSICMNLYGWQNMIFFGLNSAISVRVSNELGAGRPRAALFSVLVVLMSSVTLGIFFFVLIVALRNVYGVPFTNNPEVVDAVSRLAIVFAFSLFLNSIQPVLSGVAVGAGWQWLIAYVNLGCYYLIGVPLGYLLAFPLNKGIQGMWTGQLAGVGLQTAVLIFITWKTNWNYEASQASSRIKKWGGSTKLPVVNSEDCPTLKSDDLA
ncbi:Protein DETOXIFICATION [Rhynchospora pubera]|uniref:Protein DETOXIFICATION n=1 Tax=Rhynchospora pubera TaxID=906938 RepID=A0AAV8EQT0_9POAL|nr:Protein DETOXIFICATION [Rhynchospora pubera]